MALTTKSFAEHYNQLISYEPTPVDLVMFILREEKGLRAKIEREETAGFADVLHDTGVAIGDKKVRENIIAAKRLPIIPAWHPKVEPIQIPLPEHRHVLGFPHKAFNAMAEEEAELRRWLYGVEGRLREELQETCASTWYYIGQINLCFEHQVRGRERLMKEEREEFATYRKQLFLLAPPDFYRRVVVDRHGPDALIAAPKLPIEKEEELKRGRIVDEEEKGRRAVHEPLMTAVEMQLFDMRRAEEAGRDAIVEQAINDIYPLISDICLEDFGMTFYTLPAVMLHSGCTEETPLLQEVALAYIDLRSELFNPEKLRKELAEYREETAYDDAYEVLRMRREAGEEDQYEEMEEPRAEGEMEGTQVMAPVRPTFVLDEDKLEEPAAPAPAPEAEPVAPAAETPFTPSPDAPPVEPSTGSDPSYAEELPKPEEAPVVEEVHAAEEAPAVEEAPAAVPEPEEAAPVAEEEAAAEPEEAPAAAAEPEKAPVVEEEAAAPADAEESPVKQEDIAVDVEELEAEQEKANTMRSKSLLSAMQVTEDYRGEPY